MKKERKNNFAFCEESEEQLAQQEETSLSQSLVGVLVIVFAILLLLTRFILCCNTCAHHGKIYQLIERCNTILRKYGYYTQFPSISKNFLFCILCCGCETRSNFNLIEIYDENNSRKKAVGMNSSAQPMYNFENGNAVEFNGRAMEIEMKEIMW